MARKLTGKSVRIPQGAFAALESLRGKMARATHIGGLRLAPFGRLSDGAVIGFGLALADYVMNPRLSVIDREDFAAKFDKELAPYLAGLAHCTDDERLARIKLCVAAASQVSGYDADEPLRATPPEGSVS